MCILINRRHWLTLLGPNVIQVYNNSAIATTVIPKTSGDGTYSYVGCYIDNSDRVMSSRGSDKVNTIDGCIASCAAGQFMYAGIEYGAGDCFCSDTLPSQSLLAPDGDCNMKCNGDSTSYCGGSYRLQVYKGSSYTPISSTASPIASTFQKSSTTSNGVFIVSSSANKSTTSPTSTSKLSTTSSPTLTSTRVKTSKPPTATATTIPQLSGKYKYAGCYSDPSNQPRAVANQVKFDGTVDGCTSACSIGNYTLAGLEYGRECKFSTLSTFSANKFRLL